MVRFAHAYRTHTHTLFCAILSFYHVFAIATATKTSIGLSFAVESWGTMWEWVKSPLATRFGCKIFCSNANQCFVTKKKYWKMLLCQLTLNRAVSIQSNWSVHFLDTVSAAGIVTVSFVFQSTVEAYWWPKSIIQWQSALRLHTNISAWCHANNSKFCKAQSHTHTHTQSHIVGAHDCYIVGHHHHHEPLCRRRHQYVHIVQGMVHCCFAAGKQFLKQTKYVNNANKWHRNNPKRTCCKMQTNSLTLNTHAREKHREKEAQTHTWANWNEKKRRNNEIKKRTSYSQVSKELSSESHTNICDTNTHTCHISPVNREKESAKKQVIK